MRPARGLFVGMALLAAANGMAQLVEPTRENEKVWVESVKNRLRPCFGTLGADRSMPRAAMQPPQGELIAAVLLSPSGPMVSDGYSYVLVIHGPSNAAFVLQSGGFAGSRAVFGPIPLGTLSDEVQACSAGPAPLPGAVQGPRHRPPSN